MGRLLGADSFWSQGDDLAAASHRPPRPQACKENADAFLFLFSFTDRASFEDLPGQLARVAGEAPGVVRMVIGSKYPPGAPALLRGHVWRGAERGSGGLPVPRGGVRPRDEPKCVPQGQPIEDNITVDHITDACGKTSHSYVDQSAENSFCTFPFSETSKFLTRPGGKVLSSPLQQPMYQAGNVKNSHT